MLQGQAHSILGHTHQYEVLLDEAHRDAEAAKAEDVLVEIETVQGSTLIFRGRYEEAERVLRTAQGRARALNLPYWEAAALVNLGRIHLGKYRYDEAAGLFEQASSVSGSRFRILYSVAQDNRAMCYL